MHEPPALPQSLPPPPPHFGQPTEPSPKRGRRATCPALKQKGVAEPAPSSPEHLAAPGCGFLTQRFLPKGGIYDQPMQYMIVLPESHARKSAQGGPASGEKPGLQGSRPSRVHRQQSMLEEKPDTPREGSGRIRGQQSRAALARQHSMAEVRQAEPSQTGAGRPSSQNLVAEKRVQQRQWHQELQRARQMEEAGTHQPLRQREAQLCAAEHWTERKLQEQQLLRSKECQIQEIHQRMRGPARDAGGIPVAAASVEAARAMGTVHAPSSMAPPAGETTEALAVLQTQETSAGSPSKGRRVGRQTLHSCRVLGVSPDDGPDLIQQQYRRGALQRHPDKGGSHYQFTQLQAAKDYMEARQSGQSGAGAAPRQLHLEQPGAVAEGLAAPPASTISASSSREATVHGAARLPLQILQESVVLEQRPEKEKQAINLNPEPPPHPMSVLRGSPPADSAVARRLSASAPLALPNAFEMMVDLTGETPVHMAAPQRPGKQPGPGRPERAMPRAVHTLSSLPSEDDEEQRLQGLRRAKSGGRLSSALDAPPPPLAPAEQSSESNDESEEDLSDFAQDHQEESANLSRPSTDVRSRREMVPSSQVDNRLSASASESASPRSAWQHARQGSVLPSVPIAEATSLTGHAVHAERSYFQRQPSAASQAPSSEGEANEAPKRRSPGWNTLDSCEVLGVSPEDGYKSIQTHYRQQALRHHPDKGGRASLFRRLHDARDYLSTKQSTRWQRPTPAASRPDPAPAPAASHRYEKFKAPVNAREAPKLDMAYGEYSGSETEAKPRRWQTRTGSTECPPSPSLRRTGLSWSDDDVVGFPSIAGRQLQEDEDGSPPGHVLQAPPAAPAFARPDLLDSSHSSSPQEALNDSSLWSRQALESSVHDHLRTMDAHCAALTDTYQLLASLHGELGQAFVGLRHAWAPLHGEPE